MRSATGWDACMDVASSYFVGQAMSRHSSRASRPPRAAKVGWSTGAGPGRPGMSTVRHTTRPTTRSNRMYSLAPQKCASLLPPPTPHASSMSIVQRSRPFPCLSPVRYAAQLPVCFVRTSAGRTLLSECLQLRVFFSCVAKLNTTQIDLVSRAALACNTFKSEHAKPTGEWR